VHNIQHSKKIAPQALDATALKIRLHREKKARLAAENLIEEKSHKLFEATKEIEKVLSGGIKMLTDILSLARPELFQKAAKVQRWAKKVAPKLNVERPWELDLAAMLYPLGIIGLSDNLALKYAHDKPLSEAEREQINQSALTAYKLINNIERMNGVAQSILYSRKNFDGSGFPHNDKTGHGIPQNGRILKVLIDLADAATGADVSRSDGFMKMAAHKNEYDLDVLKICYIELLEKEKPCEKDDGSLLLHPSSLKEGDIVLKDIVDVDNKLLLASGLELSEMSIERIHDLANNKRIIGKIKILRKAENISKTTQNNLAKDAH